LFENFSEIALKPCYTIDHNVYLKEESNYSYYMRANGDPSQKGVKIKMTRTKTPKEKMDQIQKAHEYLETFWEEGFQLYRLLTDKVHIVQSNGLVSYSHFHEQGISYINFIDRDILESIDDLIHENSHHHLNLILKKYKIVKKEFKDDIFYSPWRKTLRPLYGILHATFTFSYAALLFYNIAKSSQWTFLDIDQKFLEKAYFRFIEETLYVEYSLYDLRFAIGKDLFTAKGIELIESLDKYNRDCLLYLPDVLKKIKSKELKKEIKNIQKVLHKNRTQYKINSTQQLSK
ncbi:MAG TPA: HEXXH motif-containing putative peptide modification protein, partial [Leptospiraceae bacterium]|nr:HEXXH motif-containing putative peptide modification protein [Leptospiraceae bacterium]